jgi:dipeptidyl-peptidase 4
MFKRAFSFCCMIQLTLIMAAQPPLITVEDIWKDFTFLHKGISEIRSMNDGTHFTVLESNSIVRYSYLTGKVVDTVLHGTGLSDELGNEIRFSQYSFSDDESKILLGTRMRRIYRYSTEGLFYVYDRGTRQLRPLSDRGIGPQRLADFSPDGNKVAFVRNNNLFYADLVLNEEVAITTDGLENHIINGTCDWVYEEEFSFTKGFAWSPSGRYLAYYRFDESDVREFTLTFHGDLYPRETTYKYPKAGEDNSVVTLHTYDLRSGKTAQMDTGEEIDQYIPRMKWTTTDQSLAIFRLNRLQNHLEILLANPSTGNAVVFYEEKNKYYVDITDDYWFLKDHLVLTSEKSGFNHIYVVSLKDGRELQLTHGVFDVVDIKGIDSKNRMVYYRASKNTPVNTGVYSVRLDGRRETRLNTPQGNNNVTFSKTFDYYILNWSDANTPNRFTIHDRKGTEMVILEDNSEVIALLAQYEMPQLSFGTFTTAEDVLLHYWMIRPPDFDSTVSYPLIMYVYGGPGSQTVTNSWSYTNLWFRHLAQQGFVVVSVDNRGTGRRGEEFKKCTYLQLGKFETIDQIEAAKYFGKLPFIDAGRIGIYGWSYGGYMSSLCMTLGADYFRVGIAVAPVTNWRYYDNIYTERFMRTPQENGENYDINSPIHHVEKLQGQYLLVHGLTDYNVHAQNAYDLVSALVNADKQFDMFIYPNRNHSIVGGNARNHLFRMMTQFLLNNL